MSKSKPGPSLTKSELYNLIAKETDLSKADVNRVFDALLKIGIVELKKGNAFVIPSMAKFVRKHKPASHPHEAFNPQTKQKYMTKAKPASWKVRVSVRSDVKKAVL